MKISKSIGILTVLLTLFFNILAIKASDKLISDKEYYSVFRKNESPKGYSFNTLERLSNDRVKAYYVIYKEKAGGNGFFFKIEVDKNDKPIATYYATDDNKIITESIVSNLKNIFSTQSSKKIVPGNSPAQCIINCNRRKGCYDMPTSAGALACSLECHLECA